MTTLDLRHWRTCEDCGGILVYDKADVDAWAREQQEQIDRLKTAIHQALAHGDRTWHDPPSAY